MDDLCKFCNMSRLARMAHIVSRGGTLMRIKKSFRKMLAAAVTMGTFAVMPFVSAEVREYEGFGEYVMSDFETPDIAKQRAKARAEQNAMEQAGVYVESYTKTVNARVTHDEIITMTNGILKVKDTQYEMTPIEGGKSFIIKVYIKADVDTEDVMRWLSQNKQEMDKLVEQNKELQRAKDEQDRQIEELKRQVAVIQTEQDRTAIQEKFNIADQNFISNQKVEEGFRYYSGRNYADAIVAFSQAIERDSENSAAFLGRSFAYSALGDFSRALGDSTKVVELAPDSPIAYLSRGGVYGHLNSYQNAIDDYSKAIELYPQYANAYVWRGIIFARFGDYTPAIIDCTTAIQINPANSYAYYARGLVYLNKKDYLVAIDDFTKSIELNPQASDSYKMRAMAYVSLHNLSEALVDITKAIELNPKDGAAYHYRGAIYHDMGKKGKMRADYEMSRRLGYIGGKDYTK